MAGTVTLERWGVINRVVGDDELLEKGMRFAHRLADGPTKAHGATKRLVRARDDHKRYEALAAQQLISRSALDQQAAAFKAAQGQVDAARANANVLGTRPAMRSCARPPTG